VVVLGVVIVLAYVALQGQGWIESEDAPPIATRSARPTPRLPSLDGDARSVPAGRSGGPGSGTVGLFVQPEDGRAPILDEIEEARESIALEVYLLSDNETIAALERAARRGVEVRVILEEDPFGGAGNQPEVFERLRQAGIDVRWDNPAFRFAHVKTFVVDGDVAIVMNQNLTVSSFTRNREFGVVTTRSAEVAQAAAIFEADWDRAAEPADGPLIVSPTTSREDLLGLISGAKRTLDIYAEVVRDPEIMAAIAGAERRGVAVRLIMSGDLDGTDDNAEERAELAAAGVDVRLARGGLYIHAKMVLADGARAFVGSQNFTATSLDQNRELGVFLTDRASLSRLARTFEEDFAEGQPEGGR
jgi:phosphatidylserine/phosphatidylglycerophosphate/cardiolipin synthase-like enzyme